MEVQESIQVMLVRLGQFVKTIRDPRDEAIDGVVGIIENNQTKMVFDEAKRLLIDENEPVRKWLTGGANKDLNPTTNRRYRELRDRFLQHIKQQDSKISIVTMSPLVVVRHQQEQTEDQDHELEHSDSNHLKLGMTQMT